MLGPDPVRQHSASQSDEGGAVISFEERLRRRREAAAPAPAPEARTSGRSRARVAAVQDTCWRCRETVNAIVGVIVDPALTPDASGFLPLEAIDEALLTALDARTLSRRRIGELRHRESPGVEGGYIANGCAECDALVGRFHLEDLLTEHRMAGGSFGQLDVGIAVELELEPAERRTGLTAFG